MTLSHRRSHHSDRSWKTKRSLLVCTECGHQTSITAGTIFQGTRKPLRLWFHVIWWMMSQKTGASAKNLQHTMGFRRYETAWTWLHKLRCAMIRPGRDRLKGTVGRSRCAAKKEKIVYNSCRCPISDTIILKGVYHEKIRSRPVQQTLRTSPEIT